MYEKLNFINKLKCRFRMKNLNFPNTRGIRNNNPLNIRFSSSNNWKGKIVENKKDESFEEFTHMAYGVRAFCRLIQLYVDRYKCTTIRSIVYRFAPSTENDTLRYYKFVRNFVGKLPVDPTDFTFMVRLTVAMWTVENGSQPTHGQMSDVYVGVSLYLQDYVCQ